MDAGIVRRPLGAMIVRQVVRMAVSVLLAVRFVVLVVVRNEVVEGETVMGRDEIH
jgi:hypothetical protein